MATPGAALKIDRAPISIPYEIGRFEYKTNPVNESPDRKIAFIACATQDGLSLDRGNVDRINVFVFRKLHDQRWESTPYREISPENIDVSMDQVSIQSMRTGTTGSRRKFSELTLAQKKAVIDDLSKGLRKVSREEQYDVDGSYPVSLHIGASKA